MKHPFYLLWAALLTGYLAVANTNGWSFWHSVTPMRWMPGLRGSGFSHK